MSVFADACLVPSHNSSLLKQEIQCVGYVLHTHTQMHTGFSLSIKTVHRFISHFVQSFLLPHSCSVRKLYCKGESQMARTHLFSHILCDACKGRYKSVFYL